MGKGFRSAGFLVCFALAIGTVGCDDVPTTPTPTHETKQGRMEDAVISTEVKGALAADPLIKGEQIDVDTVQGVVQLSGLVDNKTQIERAVELAQKVKGVESVKSSLAVQ